MSETVIFLAVLGGFLEIAGIAAVALDIRQGQHRARAHLTRAQTIYPASVKSSASVGSPTITGGATSTLEERVARLEAEEARMPDKLREVRRALGQDLQDELDSLRAALRKAREDDFEALESLVLGPLTEGTRARVAGVIALLIGVLLVTTSSVLSAL
jgi:hypothetical protein